jgi:hypothetical protein
MFHLNTELLIDYWRGQRGSRAVPARARIDPAGFVALAPQTFIVARDLEGDYRFRLAGEGVNNLYGRSLAGARLSPLWRPSDRRPLLAALEAATQYAGPLVVGVQARLDEADPGRLEILFAPLSGAGGRPDRFLGLCQPLSKKLSGPIRELTLRTLEGADGRPARPRLRLATVDGLRIA